MSTDRDVKRIVRSWLEEGVTALPDRVLDDVLDQIPTIRQRRAPWPARRLPSMNTTAKLALAAAAVLVVAFLGLRFMLPPNIGGPQESPAPTATPRALPSQGNLEAGTYRIDADDWTPRPFTVTVPEGWRTSEGFISKGEGTGPAPRELGDVFVATWMLTHVYIDACQWDGAIAEKMTEVGTPDEVTEALGSQLGHETSGPTAVTLGGYPAQQLEFYVPEDFEIATCSASFLRLWPDPGPNASGGLPIFAGQTVTVYVIDIDGAAFVVAAASLADASEADVAELDRMVNSIRFESSTAP